VDGQRVVLEQDRQRTDMVVVIVRDKNGIDRVDIHANLTERSRKCLGILAGIDKNTRTIGHHQEGVSGRAGI
jgi:hypothetical protein